MRSRDLLSSFIWMGFAALFIVGALQQGLFRKGIPGPGFLPFFSGIFLIVLACIVFVPALGMRKEEDARVEKFFPEKDSQKKILLGLGALFGYGIALEYTGYLLTTFLFMVLTSRIMEPERWRPILIVAFLTATLSYLLFVVLLEVQLPKGLLGI